MNITFMIGNGFDRNLGLRTAYSDFVKYYKKTPAFSENLRLFRKNIKKNIKLWSDAEVQLGQYTKEFDVGRGAAFAECQVDFCKHLSDYLENESIRINFNDHFDSAMLALSKLNDFQNNFPTEEKKTLENVRKKFEVEKTRFNFICFNYTPTLDKLVSYLSDDSSILGKHTYNNTSISHCFGGLCHVHGTIYNNMVFGVNDESQIAKPDIFDFEDGDVYKNYLIKKQTNETYLENTDGRANDMLQHSQIIYIYGMSIGDTDKLWWERLCAWILNDSNHHVILHKFGLEAKNEVFPLTYSIAERKAKHELSKFIEIDQKGKQILESRIHVTGDNIFSSIANIAGSPIDIYDQYDEIEEIESDYENAANLLSVLVKG